MSNTSYNRYQNAFGANTDHLYKDTPMPTLNFNTYVPTQSTPKLTPGESSFESKWINKLGRDASNQMPSIVTKPAINTNTDTALAPMQDRLVNTTNTENSTAGNYKGSSKSGTYTDGTLFEERLAKLASGVASVAPSIATVGEVAYNQHKLDEQDRMMQNARTNLFRAPLTSVAAAGDMSPEVLASRRADIARIRGQYQGADPTLRLAGNQMAQQQRDTALGQLNAQRAQYVAQEQHRVQQENARNQAAAADTYNKNQQRAQQLEDNKLAARVSTSERERVLYTKGLGAMNRHLDNRLEGMREADAINYNRDLAANQYEAEAMAKQLETTPNDLNLKRRLDAKQLAVAKQLRTKVPNYRQYNF